MGELHEAARRGDLRKIKELLGRGENVNARDAIGYTPLHYAAKSGHLDVVQFLVENGADVNAISLNEFLETPLHMAVSSGRLDVVRFLVERGAHVDSLDGVLMTPLHWAAGGCNLEVVRFLVEKGANVNARNMYGATPLHWAAANGCLDVVRFLLEVGADPSLRNGDGKTPLDLASERGHAEVVKLIKSWSGRKRALKKKTRPAPREPELIGLISSIDEGVFIEGEWGVLRIELNRRASLRVEGEVDWMELGEADGLVELPVKPKRAGRVPLAIVARSGGREERKIFWIEVLKRCPSCGARPEPGAKFCWSCGIRLS